MKCTSAMFAFSFLHQAFHRPNVTSKFMLEVEITGRNGSPEFQVKLTLHTLCDALLG